MVLLNLVLMKIFAGKIQLITMKKLIFLSDLWGELNNDWLKYYSQALSEQYQFKYFDVRQLANIDSQR